MDYQRLTIPYLYAYTALHRANTLNAAAQNPNEIKHLRADLTTPANVWHITPRFAACFPGIKGPDTNWFPTRRECMSRDELRTFANWFMVGLVVSSLLFITLAELFWSVYVR